MPPENQNLLTSFVFIESYAKGLQLLVELIQGLQRSLDAVLITESFKNYQVLSLNVTRRKT